MHLISTLAAGVATAGGGAVELYRRGTATRATWYQDFEGASSNSTGNDIPLDGSGSAIIYVDELVRVVVKSADNTTVRDFVAGDADAAVEVKSASFTGTAYAGGAMAPGNPTTLRAVLDRWLTSAGQGDFNVDVGGASVPLQTALSGGVRGGFFNVKDSAYSGGAVGDGVADDRTAVAAAITAAASAGGIVFFPPGTYRVSDTITVPYNVSLLGCGAAVSVIVPAHATNSGISITGSASSRRWQRISDLGVLPSASHAGDLIRTGGSVDVNLAIKGCTLGNASLSGDAFDDNATGTTRLLVEDCDIVGRLVTDDAQAEVRGCRFGPRAEAASILGGSLVVDSCYFDNSAVTGGGSITSIGSTNICIQPTGVGPTANYRITNCTFSSPDSANVVAMAFSVYATPVSSSTRVHESGNLFESGVWGYYFRVAFPEVGQKGHRIWLGSRLGKYLEVADDSALVTLTHDQALEHEIVVVKRSTSGNQTVQYEHSTYSCVPEGNPSTLMVWNESGGAITTETVNDVGGSGSGVGIADGDSILLRTQWLIVDQTLEAYAVAPIVDTGNPD